MQTTNQAKQNTLSLIFGVIVILGIALTIIITTKLLPHQDEYQFYANAFRIMGGQELHNYLHVALTEYILAGFLTVANLFTSSGVNFPQGLPSLATEYYGRILGFFLYLVGFYLSFLILQGRTKHIKVRSVIFAVLYFGSLGIFERFLRINSDSIGMIVYLNFVITSLWLHNKRAQTLEFFVYTTLFLFLASFSNLKTLYVIIPLLLLNTIGPIFIYDKDTDTAATKVPALYKLFLYGIGVIGTSLYLWKLLMPKPFNVINFWYSIKKTIVHGSRFDFDYPGQSYRSWLVYIYDFFVEYLGLTALVAILIILITAYQFNKQKDINIFKYLGNHAKKQIKASGFFKKGPYPYTALILGLSLITYYIGVSSAVVHWSRWGLPIGLLGIMLFSILVEYLVVTLQDKENLPKLLFALFLLTWLLRGLMTIDILRANYPETKSYTLTTEDVDRFLAKEGISPEEAPEKVVWFTGYTSNVGNLSLVDVVKEQHKNVQYILWPFWNIGPVYTKKTVDRETHNQRAFINKYATTITYGFPNLLSYYMHYTKLFAWDTLKITWNPEIDSLVDTQYAILKINHPGKTIALSYDLPFKDMNHYYFPHSQIFNLKNLPDGYGFPPCYSYHFVRNATSGKWSEPPTEIGVGGRTAGLYCHSARFRVAMKGTYRIRVEGLPDDPKDLQRVYLVLENFDWDPKTKTGTFVLDETRITLEFGIATVEEHLPNLKFHIFYISDVSEV